MDDEEIKNLCEALGFPDDAGGDVIGNVLFTLQNIFHFKKWFNYHRRILDVRNVCIWTRSIRSSYATAKKNCIVKVHTYIPKKPTMYDSRRKKKMLAKIKNMKDLIRTLKDNKLVNDDVNAKIMQMFASDSLAIFKSYAKNSVRKNRGHRYPMQLKHFALALYYYSPKAYQFCR